MLACLIELSTTKFDLAESCFHCFVFLLSKSGSWRPTTLNPICASPEEQHESFATVQLVYLLVSGLGFGFQVSLTLNPFEKLSLF